MPLDRKIQITQTRIIEWYQHYKGQVCVSFSGGKDSTVLLHIARQIYPDIPAVFSNTGLEYSSIQRFVKTWDNVDIVVPKMNFVQVVSTYGYPLIGKEVAEAIYYARRLSSQNGHVERGRRTILDRRKELLGRRTTLSRQAERETEERYCKADGERTSKQANRTGGGRTYPNRKANLAEISGALTTDEQQNRQRRAGVVPIGATGEGGVFSNPKAQFGEKSQFNKEKWLPLVYTPFMISHMCCHKMKKQPMHKYQHDNGYKPILATLAEESRVRKQGWIRHGCNAFESKNPMSQPMSFWTEQDVLTYLVRYAVPIASVYGEIVHVGDDGTEYPPVDLTGHVMCNLKCSGCQRTGCAFCAFGMHLEKKGKTRFHILAEVEPRKYEFALEGGQWVDNPRYDPTAPKYDGDWLNWNPKQIWVPSKKGLGMRYVFDTVNDIYGKNFYRYE